MSENEEIKQKVLEWFNKTSREGVKTKFYLKDVTKALSAEHDKIVVRKAVNDCIEEETLMWFSTGSTNMLVLPQFHKG
ncbi:dissimilatory sulfite reductase D family protein [Chloroflexota bacterium]